MTRAILSESLYLQMRDVYLPVLCTHGHPVSLFFDV